MSKVFKPTYVIYFAGGMRSRALLAWAKDIFSIFSDDAIVISVATNRTSAKTVQYMQAISEAAGFQFRLLTGCFGDEMEKSNAIFAHCREKRYQIAAQYCIDNDLQLLLPSWKEPVSGVVLGDRLPSIDGNAVHWRPLINFSRQKIEELASEIMPHPMSDTQDIVSCSGCVMCDDDGKFKGENLNSCPGLYSICE